MHPTSMDNMRKFRDKYLPDYTGKVVEVGSYNVNGTYRDLWPNNEHLGIDIQPGPNVDMVLKDPYFWPVESGSLDVVISGSTFEHVEFPEKVMEQIARTLKPGGHCCIIAPSAGPKHDFPDDYHRFTVESMISLAVDAGLYVEECTVGNRPPWKDCYMVAKKPGRKDKVSIIIPVIRTENLARLTDLIHKNVGVPDDQYEIISDEDHERIGCPKMVAMLTEYAHYNWVMFLGDDTEPEPGFLKHAIEAIKDLPDEWGMVALNDGSGQATHWMCHKAMLVFLAEGFFHTGYIHQFCDNELADISKEQGRFVYAENARIKHNHPNNGAETDDDYERVYSNEASRHDHKLYLERKLFRSGPSLGIGIPSVEEKVHSLFFQSFIQLEKPEYTMCYPKFSYHPGDIAIARNDLCAAAMASGCTHILMMDTDQVYHTVKMIPQLLAHGLPVVGAKVHRRYPPFEPILNRGGKHVPDEEIEAGGLVEVDATGTGCLLIETSLLLDLKYPWFETTREDGDTIGEDINFCRKVREKGVQIFVDCDIEIGHLSLMQVNGTLYDLWKKLTR